MGCVRSKEAKGPALKYQPDNSNVVPVNPHLGHYGPEPTMMGHSPAMKTQNSSYNNHPASLTPFGGVSSSMTPFGGASTSFTSVTVNNPFPAVITGMCVEFEISKEAYVVPPNFSLVPTLQKPPVVEDPFFFFDYLFLQFLFHLKQLLNICYTEDVKTSRYYAN